MALWSLLGPRPVTMLAWESFGEGWVTDVTKQLQAQGRDGPQGRLPVNFPICTKLKPANDIVFTWNGTTSGARVPMPTGSRRPAGTDDLRRDSACFAQRLNSSSSMWDLLLAKVLGGEGAHGMLILSPRRR